LDIDKVFITNERLLVFTLRDCVSNT